MTNDQTSNAKTTAGTNAVSLSPPATVPADTNIWGMFYPQTTGFEAVLPPELMKFDGSSAVEISPVPAMAFNEGVTVSALFKISSLDQIFHYITCRNDQDGPGGTELFLRIRKVWNNDDIYYAFQFGIWQDNTNYQAEIRVADAAVGKWIRLTGVYDPNSSGAKLQLFKDDGGTGTGDAPANPFSMSGGQYMIGAHYLDDNDPDRARYFKGEIATVSYINRPVQVQVSLSIDSDNNGYIGSPAKNAKAAKKEYDMRAAEPAKRLTYFDTAKCTINDVPLEYRRIPLRVLYFAADNAQTEFKFETASGVKVIKKADNSNAETDWTPVSSLLPSTVNNAGVYTDHYFITCQSPASNSLLDIKLHLRDQVAINKTCFDTVKVRVQEAPTNAAGQYDWIVPSGWIIDQGTGTNWSLTTMVPAEGAIPPKIEGNAYDDTQKRGYVFSTGNWNSNNNGFRMQFRYSFLRNTYDPVCNSEANPTGPTKTGYLQPDRNGDEKIDLLNNEQSADRRKISFVGNSGIKLGSFTGVREVAIFDTKAMVDRITANGASGLNAFKHEPPTAADSGTYTGVPQKIKNPVKFDAGGYITDEYEHLFQLMDGVGYDVTPGKALICDYAYASDRIDADYSVQPKQWEKLFNTLRSNYEHCQQTNNAMTIDWYPLNDGTERYRLVVWILMQTGGDSPRWVQHYRETNNEVTMSDGRIYIQSHWGSGVKFDNISIVPLTTLPPVPPAISSSPNEETDEAETDAVTSPANGQTGATRRGTAVKITAISLTLLAVGLCTLFAALVSATPLNFWWAKWQIPDAEFERVGTTYDLPKGGMVDMSNRVFPYLFVPDPADDLSPSIHFVNFDNSIIGTALRDHFDDGRKGRDGSVPYIGRLRDLGFPPKTEQIRSSIISIPFSACSFRNTVFIDIAVNGEPFWDGTTHHSSNFENAVFVRYCSLKNFDSKTLSVTANYKKHKDFSLCTFWNCNFARLDFSGFKFINTSLCGRCNMSKCNFTGADLSCLRTTGDDKTRTNVIDFTGADFTDAVISGADFGTRKVGDSSVPTCNITLEQIKQTWNYKTRHQDRRRIRSDFVKLPPDIQKALDEEKKAQDAK
jgi:hypothetical protein